MLWSSLPNWFARQFSQAFNEGRQRLEREPGRFSPSYGGFDGSVSDVTFGPGEGIGQEGVRREQEGGGDVGRVGYDADRFIDRDPSPDFIIVASNVLRGAHQGESGTPERPAAGDGEKGGSGGIVEDGVPEMPGGFRRVPGSFRSSSYLYMQQARDLFSWLNGCCLPVRSRRVVEAVRCARVDLAAALSGKSSLPYDIILRGRRAFYLTNSTKADLMCVSRWVEREIRGTDMRNKDAEVWFARIVGAIVYRDDNALRVLSVSEVGGTQRFDRTGR